MTDLGDLSVFGPTSVGWCARTPPNETTDDDGRLLVREKGFTAADPRAPARRVHDDPEVCRLRERLRTHTGLRGLDVVAPHETDRAASLLFRDGFVVVRDLLDADRLAAWRAACTRVLGEILSVPGPDGRKYMTESGRLPHRYSYGTCSASRQLLHEPVWAHMIDLPTTTPLLERIFGGDYVVLGAGGDLCLPGAIEYQALHADIRETWQLPPERLAQAQRLGVALRREAAGGALTHTTRHLIFERTPPVVTINFFMSDLTFENGPIRQIPGTQLRIDAPPTPADEPEWMRLCTLVGAAAGWGVIRDNRAWHGATPNVSREVRAMPNVEYGAPWIARANGPKTLPHAAWETLTPHARHIAAGIKADPGVWPAGAGVNHPLAAARRAANGGAYAQAPV